MNASAGNFYRLAASRSGPLRGVTAVPGDKSISHRALILGLVTAGETHISGLLESADVLATARVCQQLGALIERGPNGRCQVYGRGIGALKEPSEILDFENSGTSVRLMMGLIATHPIRTHLTGDASLSRRPMERVLRPLAEFGAIGHSRDGCLPIYLQGTERPVPIDYEIPVPSAQVKSALLLAALNTPGDTTIIERTATRDHTERMLAHFGAQVSIEHENAKRIIVLKGQPELTPHPVDVPGDPSSAAFLIVAGLLVPGSAITVRNVLLNPARTGLLVTLEEMGAALRILNEREIAGERVGDIEVAASALRGVDVPPERAASMIDEYPVLGVAAAFAQGRSRMSGLGELRVKESDRLSAIAAGLEANGVTVRQDDDWLEVDGRGGDVPGGGTVATQLDHRIAMAFLVMGLAAKAPVTVDDASMIGTSFPNFAGLFASLGAQIRSPEKSS